MSDDDMDDNGGSSDARDQDRGDRPVTDIDTMNIRHAAVAALLVDTVAQWIRDRDPGEIPPTQIARLLATAVRIERLARGVLAQSADTASQPRALISASQIREMLQEAGALAPPRQAQDADGLPADEHLRRWLTGEL